jgi:FMN phosphatase YigB (HAD superfamily)
VDKVLDVKATAVGRNLKNVYILTNGVADWTEQLKEALGRAAKWDRIVSSKDIELNKEQKYIAPAIDMMIGQRGQVFVGNGVRRI